MLCATRMEKSKLLFMKSNREFRLCDDEFVPEGSSIYLLYKSQNQISLSRELLNRL